jgi:Family of unknown function (DUF5519)
MSHPSPQPKVSGDARQEASSVPPLAMALPLSRTSTLKEVWDVVKTVEAWPGVTIAPDGSGLCLTLGGVTLGHLRWNGRIDLPFAPEAGNRLIAEGMASRDPDRPGTNRVVFDVRTAADVDRAVWLLRLAYLSMDSKADTCASEVEHSASIPGDGSFLNRHGRCFGDGV